MMTLRVCVNIVVGMTAIDLSWKTFWSLSVRAEIWCIVPSYFIRSSLILSQNIVADIACKYYNLGLLANQV